MHSLHLCHLGQLVHALLCQHCESQWQKLSYMNWLNNFVRWVLTNTQKIFLLHAHCHISIHTTESQPPYSWSSNIFHSIFLTSCPGYSVLLPMSPYLFSTCVSSFQQRNWMTKCKRAQSSSIEKGFVSLPSFKAFPEGRAVAPTYRASSSVNQTLTFSFWS